MSTKSAFHTLSRSLFKTAAVTVFDCETTTDWEHGPAATVGTTKLVSVGWANLAFEAGTHVVKDTLPFRFTAGDVVVAGHNIPFDAMHVLKDCFPETRAAILKRLASGALTLVDSQDLEYLITGHRDTWSSLDDLLEKYGFEKKKDTLKEYFANGINTDAIPTAELNAYLEHDIFQTAKVLNAQAAAIMEGTTATAQVELATMRTAMATVMMWNGMPFDLPLAKAYAYELEKQIAEIVVEWEEEIKSYGTTHGNPILSEALRDMARDALSSPKKLSNLLYGGQPVKYKERQQVGTYKNGKPKYKTETVEFVPPQGYAFCKPPEGGGTDEPSLTALRAEKVKLCGGVPTFPINTKRCIALIDLVLKYRELTKILGTYVKPLIEMAEASMDGRIHPSINTNATATGRLSSSKPNAQNMPSNAGVKDLFREEGWTCVEGDFKQLEMVALAVKTGDVQLLTDLAAGIDIHFEVGKEVYGWKVPADMTKETRRIVKSIDFGLVYGGKAKTLSAQSGAPVEVVQKIIDAFFKRYPLVYHFHQRMEKKAKDEKAGAHTGKALTNGELERILTVSCGITGRKYCFVSYPNERKYGPRSSFSPTEMKNYLVQGLATADFVPFAANLLMRCMEEAGWMDLEKDGQPKAKLCNTVHDSVVAWVKHEYAEEFAILMKGVLEAAWVEMFKFFNCPDSKRHNTQVVCEISMGPSWGETKEVTIK